MELWPGQIPLGVPDAPPETLELSDETPPNRHYRNVAVPALTIYRPARAKDKGIAAVICPGGGYGILSWDKEGITVAQWLQAHGVTGAVLKSRLPCPHRIPNGHLVSLLDAQRAMRLLRRQFDRLGIIGFSAGAHLAACVAIKFSEPVFNSLEDVRAASCRPDFCVLVYPVITMPGTGRCTSRDNLLGPNAPESLRADFSCERWVTPKTPLTFLVHARDDPVVPVENSLAFADACRDAGVPVELHLYDKGGHGFGLGVRGGEVATWPGHLEKFLDPCRAGNTILCVSGNGC